MASQRKGKTKINQKMQNVFQLCKRMWMQTKFVNKFFNNLPKIISYNIYSIKCADFQLYTTLCHHICSMFLTFLVKFLYCSFYVSIRERIEESELKNLQSPWSSWRKNVKRSKNIKILKSTCRKICFLLIMWGILAADIIINIESFNLKLSSVLQLPSLSFLIIHQAVNPLLPTRLTIYTRRS